MLRFLYLYDTIKVMDTESYEKLLKGEYAEKFNIFKEFLVESNQKFNLTSITDDEGIFYKHFLDSVVGESFFKKGAFVVEIGSGGGFPSIPLKIIRDDLNFLLVESTGKKCAYLKEAVDKLGFNGVSVYCGRAEDAAKDVLYREKFDVATARAVARLNTLCEYCLPFVKVGGSFIAYKGDCEEEIKQAENAIKTLGGKLERVENYSLKGEDKRAVIVIKKVVHTPQKYPRGNGKERKCPIL